jgi:hypothetical protein
MRFDRIITAVLFATFVGLLSVAPTFADSNGPSTLLHWGTGKESDEVGSDLDKPLEADRPDFTESPKTVGKGVVQLEAGYTFTYDNEAGVRTANHSFPETLLRVGVLADWLELRADWNYEIERTRTAGVKQTASGADDLILGVKLALTPQECMLPETGVIFEMSVPTGGDDFTADRVLPGVNYCVSWDLNKDWSLSGSTIFEGAVDQATTDTYTQFAQSLSLERTWSEQLRSYTEWYVLAPIGADTQRPQYYFNGGFLVFLNKDVQWDIRAGVGLNDAADDFFVGSGFALRYY